MPQKNDEGRGVARGKSVISRTEILSGDFGSYSRDTPISCAPSSSPYVAGAGATAA